MDIVQSSHQFADATTAQIPGLKSNDCHLIILQEPLIARVAIGKEKDRKPVDPPPVIQLTINPSSDPAQNYLQSPYFFMSCSLVGVGDGTPQGTLGAALAGTLVSSLHRLKDAQNNDGAFFVFGDLSVKLEGTFRLQFNLYEMRNNQCYHIQAVQSKDFPVLSSKNFQGMGESTPMTRSFSEQGVRLRLRKEPRTLLRKRGPADDDYLPRHYRTTGRQSSQGAERPSVTSSDSQGTIRPGHIEHGDFVESPQGFSSYDQRPSLGRQYSQPSYQGSMSYDESSKRPRTGSEQSQTPSFNQQVLQSPQYSRTLYAEPQQSSYGSFPQQAQQQPNFSYQYGASGSPHGSGTPQAQRDNYFAQKGLNTQTAAVSPYAQSARSPDYAHYPPQPQAIAYHQKPQEQYGTSQLVSSQPSLRIGLDTPTQSQFEGLGISEGISPIISAPMSTMQATMAPPSYGRQGASMYSATPSRRDPYTGYQSSPVVSMSAGSMAGNMAGIYSTRMPVVTTSGPGIQDANY